MKRDVVDRTLTELRRTINLLLSEETRHLLSEAEAKEARAAYLHLNTLRNSLHRHLGTTGKITKGQAQR